MASNRYYELAPYNAICSDLSNPKAPFLVAPGFTPEEQKIYNPIDKEIRQAEDRLRAREGKKDLTPDEVGQTIKQVLQNHQFTQEQQAVQGKLDKQSTMGANLLGWSINQDASPALEAAFQKDIPPCTPQELSESRIQHAGGDRVRDLTKNLVHKPPSP